MVQSLKMSGTEHDILVLVSDNVRESTRQKLTAEGCKIIQVPNIHNPYRQDEQRRVSYKPRFEYTLNKLHLWNFTDYERIIYLDADNVILHSMDELFMCGHFCVVFMNMCVFHTGLMVIKPDTAVFQDMLKQLASLSSDDGADQGFLSSYFADMEFAPLFNVSAGKSERPKERLFSGYNLNHMYFYENWNFNRYRKYHFANLTIPGLSLAYPIAPTWKPWYWYMYIGLKWHWEWDTVRTQLGDDHTLSFLVSFLIITINYILSSPSLAAKTCQKRGSYTFTKIHNIATELVQQLSWKIGKRSVAVLLSFIGVGAGMMFGISVVPGLLPPKLAWPLFIAAFDSIYVIVLKWFSWVCGSTPANPELVLALSFFADSILVLIEFADIYSSPIQKVSAFVVLISVFLALKAYWFVNVAKTSAKLKKGGKIAHTSNDTV